MIAGGCYIHIRVWVLSHSYFVLFLLVLWSFVLSLPVSFLSVWSMMAVVSVSLFIICFLCSGPVMEKSWWKLWCLSCKTIYKVSI